MIQPKSLKPCYDLMDFLSGYPMHTSSILIRRGLVVIPTWVDQVTNIDTCVFALHAEKGPVGYLNEVTSCYRLHVGGVWIGRSPLEKHRSQRKTFDLLDSHFSGRYRDFIRLWEYHDAMATTRLLVESGMSSDAREIYKEMIPRIAVLMPFRVAAWGIAVFGGFGCRIAWNRLRVLLAIRTRFRWIMHRTKISIARSL